MLTPPKGDYASVPLNAEGRSVRRTRGIRRWTARARPYGVGGLMRMPLRLRISWQDDTTLKIETDAGQQTRLLHFGPAPANPGPTLASGTIRPPSGRCRPRAAAARGTRRAGDRCEWSRPICAAAGCAATACPTARTPSSPRILDRHSEGDAGEWFIVTTTVEDPRTWTQPFITSSNFKKEADGSKWSPTPCKAG